MRTQVLIDQDFSRDSKLLFQAMLEICVSDIYFFLSLNAPVSENYVLKHYRKSLVRYTPRRLHLKDSGGQPVTPLLVVYQDPLSPIAIL